MKSIGQIAQSTGCNVETIRYYEKRGLLGRPTRSAGGHRLYDRMHENRIAFIRHSRALGFGLDEIGELIALAGEDGGQTCQEALEVAERHLQTVREKLVRLERIRDTLLQMTRECRNGCARIRAPSCSMLDILARP